jgi:hypothetical protein
VNGRERKWFWAWWLLAFAIAVLLAFTKRDTIPAMLGTLVGCVVFPLGKKLLNWLDERSDNPN